MIAWIDSMKPVVTDKHPCYQIYIKTDIYLLLIILYNSSITYIEHQDSDNHKVL